MNTKTQNCFQQPSIKYFLNYLCGDRPTFKVWIPLFSSSLEYQFIAFAGTRMIILRYVLELPSGKKTWNNWKLAKYCQLSNILLKHYWFVSMLFSYYSIFTSTRYFIRKPRTVLCKHTMSTRTCSNIQRLPGRQMGEKTLRKAPTPSLGFQEVCEHHKWTDLLAVVSGQTMHNSIHFVNRSCNLSIAKSKLKKIIISFLSPLLDSTLAISAHVTRKACNSPYTEITEQEWETAYKPKPTRKTTCAKPQPVSSFRMMEAIKLGKNTILAVEETMYFRGFPKAFLIFVN